MTDVEDSDGFELLDDVCGDDDEKSTLATTTNEKQKLVQHLSDEKKNRTDEDKDSPVVVLELPESMLKDDGSKTRVAPPSPPPRPLLKKDSAVASSCSTNSLGSTSTFLQRVGALKIDKDEVFASDTDTEAWSKVGGDSANGYDYNDNDDNSTVAASSTISGFHLLSLAGAGAVKEAPRKPHSCKMCTFLNKDESEGVCVVCGHVWDDEALARKLQEQEERLAFKELQVKEKKRKSLTQMTLLDRSQFLVDEVRTVAHDILRNSRSNGVGVEMIQELSHVILASRFIDHADLAIMNGGTITLAYHFSRDTEHKKFQIRQDGLGPNANISNNIEAAYWNPGHRRSTTHTDALLSSFRNGIYSIPEGDTAGIPQGEERRKRWRGPRAHPSECSLGWIVATTNGRHSERDVRVSSGWSTVRTVSDTNQTFPLVCFNASLRKDDITRRLMNGLSKICFDFFQDCSMGDQKAREKAQSGANTAEHAPQSPKKARLSQDPQVRKSPSSTSASVDEAVQAVNEPGTSPSAASRPACGSTGENLNKPQKGLSNTQGNQNQHPSNPASSTTTAAATTKEDWIQDSLDELAKLEM